MDIVTAVFFGLGLASGIALLALGIARYISSQVRKDIDSHSLKPGH